MKEEKEGEWGVGGQRERERVRLREKRRERDTGRERDGERERWLISLLLTSRASESRTEALPGVLT